MTINLSKLIEAARKVVKSFDEAQQESYDECCWEKFKELDDVQPLRDALGDDE